MDERILQEVQNYISLQNGLMENLRSDEQHDDRAEVKLKKILSECPEGCEKGEFEQIKSVILSFINTNEANKRKLLSYCLNFIDPTGHRTLTCGNDAEIVLQAYLNDDELAKLSSFIKRHKDDRTFGDTVYMIMDKHGMKASQVYKNALMSRQDFSRVTNPRRKNVTRKMVWQIIIGMHCSLEEADEVLFSAGYIRRNDRFDLTLQYFIQTENYDIEAIDAVLSEFKLKTFACE